MKDNKDQTPVETKETDQAKPVKKHSKFVERLKSLVRTKKRKVLVSIVAVLLVLGVLFAIPVTRYGILGLVIKKQTVVSVVDSVSKKPISEASVSLAGQTVKTNNKGDATLKSVPVGQYQLKVEKKYYQATSQNFTVPILSGKADAKIEIKATGRQVLVKVTNKVSATPLEGATITVSDTKATTDKNGEAAIVLPINSKPQNATVTREGFNQSQLTLTVANKADQKAEISLMPAGKIYYLSKRTGKLNVVKSNLDGTEPQMVVEGIGRESDHQTSLLASRDWKYLALHTRRDGDKPKIYLINTSNDHITVMDEGDASFNLVGWSGHRFIFTLDRTKEHYWDEKKYAIKSYDANSGKLTTLDESEGGGSNSGGYDAYGYESFSNIYITNDRIIYAKDWNINYYSALNSNNNKALGIMSVKPEGGGLQRLKEFDESQTTYANLKLYAPNEVYFQVTQDGGKVGYYEYENGKIIDAPDIDEEKFNDYYPTYLVSPTDDKTFWYEPRDGKNTLLVGDKEAKNRKEVATLSEYKPYGWFSDEYLLVSKSGSELYILSRTNPAHAPVKVSDYHKPQVTYDGYGYGYGGQ